MREVVSSHQRLAQAVWILIREMLTVEAGMRCVKHAVMVRAHHHDISADIRTALGEVLDMVGVGHGYAVQRLEVHAADLAATVVIRFQALWEPLVAHENLCTGEYLGHRTQDCDAVVVVDGREGTRASEFLCHLRCRNELQSRRWQLGEVPLDVGQDDLLVLFLDVAGIEPPLVAL